MAALECEFFGQYGKVAVQFRAALLVPDLFYPLVHAARNAVEDKAPDIAVLAKMQKALHLRGDGKRTAPAVHDEHGGRVQAFADVVRAVLVGKAHAVIIPHRPLDQIEILRGIGKHRGKIFSAEVTVQISAFSADDGAVKHGIDIIGPAFERRNVRAEVFERLAAARRKPSFCRSRCACPKAAGAENHPSFCASEPIMGTCETFV